MPEHPNSDLCASNVIQEMIGESIQIEAPKSTSVKMEILRVCNYLADPELKLREEILSELPRHSEVFVQDRVQVRLNTPVKSSFHGNEAQQRVRQT